MRRFPCCGIDMLCVDTSNNGVEASLNEASAHVCDRKQKNLQAPIN